MGALYVEIPSNIDEFPDYPNDQGVVIPLGLLRGFLHHIDCLIEYTESATLKDDPEASAATAARDFLDGDGGEWK